MIPHSNFYPIAYINNPYVQCIPENVTKICCGTLGTGGGDHWR